MKETFQFNEFGSDLAVNYAKEIAGCRYTEALGTVISVAFRDIRNLQNFRFKETDTIDLKQYVKKFIEAYLKGFDSRPSVKIGKKSATHSDSIIKIILQARLPNIEPGLANQIEGGHSLMMTIENLVGDLLEEFLSIKLAESGWCCCWGSTIDAVDFCKNDGSLLQVKNSDNSENSSSSRVRNGTEIDKWARRKSTQADTFFWAKLNEKTGRNDLNEAEFREFVIKTISNNPDALYIEDNHPLNEI